MADNDNEGPLDAGLRAALAAHKASGRKREIDELRDLAQDLLNSYQRFASNADGCMDPELERRARELGLDVDAWLKTP